ncbi:signal peptide peptidase SppA [Synoicihabitans lomoniglobus]|uniref:Signal peptide peptidase SppA n=1 Tax=Synoicihabitans lomoniglobus TaxID=2909285 RepID=A0AAF0CS90_9BACT|nr:signal peptide peptidase SppA [Opitutaceae bacterium LMO-M01]WED67145.1 signal peptide peptidase SppA [Opitutaceae bacterium LMO-M01]
MKTFFASLLGSLTGFLLLFLGGGFLLFLFMMFAAAMGEPQQQAIKSGSYVVFDLSTNISDAPVQLDDSAILAAFSGQDVPAQLQTRQVTRALHEIAQDDRIAGVYLTGSFTPQGYGTSFATLQEVRRGLEAIKAAGKPIQAYLDYPDTRDFYLASVADDIGIDPNGVLLMPGLATEPTFLAGLFDKFGIGVQVSRVGKYKSAVETYTRRDFSAENREQLESLLGDLWTQLRDTVATARGMDPATFQSLVDSGKSFIVSDLVEAGLVDRVLYADEIYDELKQLTGVTEPKEAFKQVNLTAYIRQMSKVQVGAEESPAVFGSKQGKVAVIYAEGAIVGGQGRPTDVGGKKFSREIRRLRQDPSVKAIVLRVNSPGGSAAASEHIQRELRLAMEKMPVVVSMGGYAASGGYWISAYSHRIFAEPTTITGSIGVFSMLFNIQELGHDLGLSWDSVKTGEFADALSASRPKTEAELALFQRGTDDIYRQFVAKVAEGRGLDPARVEEIAQGRVWSGTSALEIGLVDEIGGLADAIAFAASEAGLSEKFRLYEFPRKKELAEVIAEAINKLQPGSAHSGLISQVSSKIEASLEQLEQFNDPRGIYARMPTEFIVK